MNKMERTIEYQKSRRQVPDELKNHVKAYNQRKKVIKNALKPGPKSIPQITAETGLDADQVMYVLMTLRKYNEVEVDELDDMDEYFTYKLSKSE